MKNKKLFAILTLVCFMFTLMPVAAFAADPAGYAVKVYEGSELESNVYVTNAPGGVTVTASAVTKTVSETAIDVAAVYYAVNEEGKGVQVVYAPATTTTAAFKFLANGTYKIFAVVDETTTTTAYQATTMTQLQVLVAKANSLLESTTAADVVNTIQTNPALAAKIIKTPAVVTVEPQDSRFVITAEDTTGSYLGLGRVLADNGFSAAGNKQVEIEITDNGVDVVGKAPTITAPEYVTVVPANPKQVVTDAFGDITYNISANRAGTFNVVFSYETARVVVKVEAYTDNTANVEVVKDPTNLINNDANADVATGVVVKFTDDNGKAVVTTGSATEISNAYYLTNNDQVKVSVVSQPAGSRLDPTDFAFVASTAYPGAVELVVLDQNALLKVGTYKLQFALANGKAVTVDFETAKMSPVYAGIRFEDPMKTVALNTTFSATDFDVYAFDANGVEKKLTVGSGNDYILTLQGKALDSAYTVSDDEKYIGSTITVLAKTTDDKFVATTTVEVVDNGAEVVYVNNTAEVGVTTTLKAKVLDVKGNKVDAAGLPYVVVLEKPAANAYVSATPAVAGDGTITVTFLASVAGEYKIQTIVDAAGVYVTGTETIKVGLNDTTFKDVIVMSIGANTMVKNSATVAMPAAPEIVDSRTMVPARAGLEAFGAVVAWDEATQTVTAELNGVKVVMTIGEKAYTVNGKVVVGDAAPYITAASTMVPVSFFTNAFGITATPIYDANGVCDVLFTK